MARKSKRTIKVELNLPKDDVTESRLITIIVISLILSLSCFGIWVTNSLSHPNGQPIFVNLACQVENPNRIPSWHQNETCPLLRDSPSEEKWTGSFRSVGQGMTHNFEVPGIPEWTQSPRSFGDHPSQDIAATCFFPGNFFPPEYSMRIAHYRDDDQVGTTVAEGVFSGDDECSIQGNIPGSGDLVPGEGYQIEIVPKEGIILEGVDFKVTVMAYDGIPENMNNKSKFLGPEVLSFRPLNFLNWFSFGIFLLLFPAAAYWDRVKQKIADKEDKFPDFLRDLAEFWKGGLSMTVAVQTLTTSEYGALNDEIKKMSDQISWGIAFEDVLIMFASRINTPLVDRAISLINEANRAGGKISDILVTAANDTREIKFLEEERVRAISSYKAVIWTSFFVFLGVVVVLAKVFIPAIASSNAGEGGGSTTLGAMEIRAVDPLFFLTVFFYGVVMQGVGNGAMAGLMATGRVSAGFKLSGMMVLVAFVAFNLIAFSPSLMGVPPPQGLNPAVSSNSGGVFAGGG